METTAARRPDAGVISLISDEEEGEEGGPAASNPVRMETQDGGGGGDALTRFLLRYGGQDAAAPPLEEVVRACASTPYCLLLYTGVELDGGGTTGVVLVRYLDRRSGAGAVRPLLALPMDGGVGAADADAQLLVEALKEAGLNLRNLAVFFCDTPHPAVSRVLLFRLKAFSPAAVSLSGLPAMAARACQAGLLASFSYVVGLVRDVHRHCSAFPPLAGGGLPRPPRPPGSPSADCLFAVRAVQWMTARWRPLLDHFKSADGSERIRERLADPRVQLDFAFLSEVLQPLRVLQEVQDSASEDVAAELQMAAALLRSYAARVLRPPAVQLLLERRSLRPLHRAADLLPPAEVNVGVAAREFLWATPAVDLGEEERRRFRKAVQAFFRAALQSLVQSVPEQLEDAALWNISTLLKHPENLKDAAASRQVLPALCAQLGLCDAASPEARRLVDDFLCAVDAVDADPKRTDADGHCWTKVLQRMPPTTLQRLLLTLAALPSSLRRPHVFAQMATTCAASRQEALEASTDVRARTPVVRLRKLSLKAEPSSSEDDVKPSVVWQVPSKYESSEDSDYTDNSSDVVDVTHQDEPLWTRRFSKLQNGGRHAAAASDTSDTSDTSSDEEDGDVDVTTAPPPGGAAGPNFGDLVWGQVEGFSRWPAVVTSGSGVREDLPPGTTRVKWYGQEVSAAVATASLTPFAEFRQSFSRESFAIFNSYREAVFSVLQVAALRCRKQFAAPPADKERQLEEMLAWALGGFGPAGPDTLRPKPSGVTHRDCSQRWRRRSRPKAVPSPPPDSPSVGARMKEVSVSLTRLSCAAAAAAGRPGGPPDKEPRASTKKRRSKAAAAAKTQEDNEDWEVEGEEDDSGGEEEGEEKTRGRGGWRGRKGPRKNRDAVDGRRKTGGRGTARVNRGTKPYQQPDQRQRENTIRRIMKEGLNIEEFCLCCGTRDIKCLHPLFKGSLCLACKDNFTETLYRYDDDGYQSYCTVCCYGMEVVLCGNESCCRSYCGDCVNILVGPGAFDSLKLLDPWICYMCQNHRAHGALEPRDDWSVRVQELFDTDSGAMEFEPHRVYPCVPASQRRPLRVLSLFDGIATGYVVLKELGLKLDRYVASEICPDSIAVSTINHEGRILHVGDVRAITKEQLDRWGPFDLLIGGSPCNDLAIVNPFRKGIYEGTGRLFFDYYRILHMLKPRDDDPRPFFWLFENVVFMNVHNRVNICRFLECNPVLVDAIDVSPAHRARYFWGNIPGMNRPIIASKNDKLNLQDCLELGRTARVNKVRTITTNPNCLKQGKKQVLLPVLQDGQEDHLWVTELERIFGFPKHYTDVRNMGKKQRLTVLGKSWSVPVVRHLLAPLKDYFACEELSPVTNSTSSSSSSSSSPASPDVLQFR